MEYESCLICIPITTVPVMRPGRCSFIEPDGHAPAKRLAESAGPDHLIQNRIAEFIANDRRNVSSPDRPDHGPQPIEASKKVGLSV